MRINLYVGSNKFKCPYKIKSMCQIALKAYKKFLPNKTIKNNSFACLIPQFIKEKQKGTECIKNWFVFSCIHIFNAPEYFLIFLPSNLNRVRCKEDHAIVKLFLQITNCNVGKPKYNQFYKKIIKN